MDRLYTSFPVARWLLSRHITMVGTMQKNRSGLPKEITSIQDREDLSTKLFWADNGKINLSSYVVKTKSSGKKNVLLLSSMQPLFGITKDDGKKKPAHYKLYDFRKGGTDECDKRAETYSCKPKSRKWTIVAFSYVLDMARINASTILALNKGQSPRRSKLSSFDFCWNLLKSLVLPFIESRSMNGLTGATQLKIEIVTGKSVSRKRAIGAEENEPPKKRRCSTCLDNITGAGKKGRKDSLPKITTFCEVCKHTFCKKHLILSCASCNE